LVSIKTLSLAILATVVVAALSGAIALLVTGRGSGSPGVEIILPTPTSSPELRVYVSGAVARPGVYTMADGQRVSDAVDAAGGAGQDAMLSCVNLALRVRDEAHYHVPGAGEPCQAGAAPSGETGPPAGIDLNSATVDELETLPGIGPARARAMVDYRERNGGFKSTQQVMEVPGIGPAIYENIRDLVYVGPSGP
jgi:competence protein ComEA